MLQIHRITGRHPDSLHFHVYDNQDIERYFRMVEVCDGQIIRGEEYVMQNGRHVGWRLWYTDDAENRPLPFYYRIRGELNGRISA